MKTAHKLEREAIATSPGRSEAAYVSDVIGPIIDRYNELGGDIQHYVRASWIDIERLSGMTNIWTPTEVNWIAGVGRLTRALRLLKHWDRTPGRFLNP